jgi:fructokinase
MQMNSVKTAPANHGNSETGAHKIVGVGELLWDIFPDGPRFGGAPVNFACTASSLARGAANVSMVTAVGDDALGREALAKLQQFGVDASCVQVTPEPTGQVLVQIDDAGLASYEFASDTAWDNLTWAAPLSRLAQSADAVCFGTLGQRSARSRAVIRQFVQATPAATLRVFDINLRPPFWDETVILESLPLANVLKCNEDELPILAELTGVGGSVDQITRTWIERYGLRVVAITQGSLGSTLYGLDEDGLDEDGLDEDGLDEDGLDEDGLDEVSRQDAIPTDVVDTVGAGDAFTAALVLGLLDRRPLTEIHAWANRVSAFVCSQAGATPTLPSII